MDVSGRRVATIRISSHLMAAWLSKGTEAATVENPLADMKIVGARYNAWAGMVEILVESPDLEVVKDGETPPEYMPTFKSDTCEKKSCGCVVDC